MKEANVRNGDDTIRILLTQHFHFNSLIIPYPRPTRLSLQLNTMLTHRFSLVLMVSRNATTVFAVLVRIAVVAVAAPPPPPLPTPALPLEAGRLPVVLDTAECSGAFLVRPNQFIVAISYEHRRAGVVGQRLRFATAAEAEVEECTTSSCLRLAPWSWSVRHSFEGGVLLFLLLSIFFNFEF